MALGERVIVPAIMADEWDALVVAIESVAGASDIQIDVMDGVLVPSFSFPYNRTMLSNQMLPHVDTITYEIHLMVQHPLEVGERFIAAGAKRVVAQIEGFRPGEATRVLNEWKMLGADVGVSVQLDTPMTETVFLVESGVIDTVQVMSIARIGYQGEMFDERALVRVRELRAQFSDVTIAVDGGVHGGLLKQLVEAGVNRFGVGSAIMQAPDPMHAYKELSQALEAHAHHA